MLDERVHPEDLARLEVQPHLHGEACVAAEAVVGGGHGRGRIAVCPPATDVDWLAVKRVVVAGALALALAGCGKSGTSLYTKDATTACLTKAGLTPRPVDGTSDFVANSATGGAFHVAVAGNDVTVSFGETVGDADNLDQAYRRFRAKNVGIEDVLRRQGNAVMLWHEHPQDTQLGTITSCLKG
jgi:hypothetical protein